MAHPRTFDYETARRLRADGWTYTRIADHLGVSGPSIARACDPDLERRQAAKQSASKHWIGTCVDCGGPATSRHRARNGRRCRACWAASKITTVRPDALRCYTCGEWKPDDAFSRSAENPSRRWKHGTCKECWAATRRVRRARMTADERATIAARERKRRADQRARQRRIIVRDFPKRPWRVETYEVNSAGMWEWRIRATFATEPAANRLLGEAGVLRFNVPANRIRVEKHVEFEASR